MWCKTWAKVTKKIGYVIQKFDPRDIESRSKDRKQKEAHIPNPKQVGTS